MNSEIALTSLSAKINENHLLAMQHAGKAIEHAIACGELLIEAKSKCAHGQWLPWLRESISFSERTCQAYMRIAKRVPRQIRSGVADLSVRGVLQELSTPRRQHIDAVSSELAEWLEKARSRKAGRPVPEQWILEDAMACADSIRGVDKIMHLHGLCCEEHCTVCAGEVAA